MESVSTAPEDGEEIDPWGGEDEVEQSPSTRSLDLQREWEARRLQFHNLGYRDGITAGNNSSVQEGFNVGFHEAVEPGFNWGVARGAASAYASLPSKLKELLLKDGEAGKRLESLDSTLSDISSAEAMGMFYKDSILRKQVTTEDSLEAHAAETGRSSSSAETPVEAEATANQTERGDSANACCGGGACSESRACSSEVGSSGNKPVSEEAYNLILRVGTSSADARQLEVSTTNHLSSMALGHPFPKASSMASESSSRLEVYQRNVSAELEPFGVNLSTFPQLHGLEGTVL